MKWWMWVVVVLVLEILSAAFTIWRYPCAREEEYDATCGGYQYCAAYMSIGDVPVCAVYTYVPEEPCVKTRCVERRDRLRSP